MELVVTPPKLYVPHAKNRNLRTPNRKYNSNSYTMKAYAIQLLLLILVIVPYTSEARIKGNIKNGEDRSLYYAQNNGKNGQNYYGKYYQRRYYYNYNKRRYYANDDDANLANAGDDGAAVDDAVSADDTAAQGDDVQIDDGQGDDYIASYLSNNTSSGWRGTISSVEEQVRDEFRTWYYTPPGEWTTEEWALLGGISALILGSVFCICMCCCRPSSGFDGAEKTRRASTYDFDDYTSIDSRKGSSKGSSASDSSIDSDGNATYDSIMRLRSD